MRQRFWSRKKHFSEKKGSEDAENRSRLSGFCSLPLLLDNSLECRDDTRAFARAQLRPSLDHCYLCKRTMYKHALFQLTVQGIHCQDLGDAGDGTRQELIVERQG